MDKEETLKKVFEIIQDEIDCYQRIIKKIENQTMIACEMLIAKYDALYDLKERIKEEVR